MSRHSCVARSGWPALEVPSTLAPDTENGSVRSSMLSWPVRYMRQRLACCFGESMGRLSRSLSLAAHVWGLQRSRTGDCGLPVLLSLRKRPSLTSQEDLFRYLRPGTDKRQGPTDHLPAGFGAGWHVLGGGCGRPHAVAREVWRRRGIPVEVSGRS